MRSPGGGSAHQRSAREAKEEVDGESAILGKNGSRFGQTRRRNRIRRSGQAGEGRGWGGDGGERTEGDDGRRQLEETKRRV